MTSLEHCLNYALREAVYNRKNTGPWLGVYNDDHYGIVMAVRLAPQEPFVQLDVPEEVIAYWRQYQYKKPTAARSFNRGVTAAPNAAPQENQP
jgi:hypothetical protein